MNNILNEITYCDGRIADKSSSILEDSPSRLKLRPNTFDGICASSDARRVPAFNASDFAIPAANMASGVYATDEGTGTPNGGFVILNSENTTVNGSNNGPKRLSVKENQIKGIEANQLRGVEQTQVDNTPIAPVAPIVNDKTEEVVAPTIVAPIQPTGDVSAVEQTNIQETPTVEVAQPEIAVAPVAPIVNEQVEVAPAITTPMQPTEETNAVEQTNTQEVPTVTTDNKGFGLVKKEFTALQEATKALKESSENEKLAIQKLGDVENKVKDSENELANLKEKINGQHDELKSLRGRIAAQEQEGDELNREIDGIRKDISNQIGLVKEANEKVIANIKAINGKIDEANHVNANYQKEIITGQQEYDKNAKAQAGLIEEEEKAKLENVRRRDELDELKRLRDALASDNVLAGLQPEEKTDMNNVSSGNFIPFPINAGNSEEQGVEYQKSLKNAA